MKWMILGLLLVAGGAAALFYKGIPYTTHEKVLDVGPIHATTDVEKTLVLPWWVGAGAVGLGALILLVGAGRRAR